ncbi:hypothetical protein GH714_019206 [Hevea brasiliensis]|uniref:tRNA/rRNA methyltransferase SpoU type domain-containing protein n=1 Tax=Hevea brasiliensis TaxID=3981 RepID=A0A6A6MFM3_HEVBR|nr:hypothetical protein GH714_019206 [Hevea brasiliensis]
MGVTLSHKVGTMIEIPRAALVADEVLDQKGVGQLIKMATEKGRAARPSLKVGICGEHGGEPSSVAFFAEAGLDYVSCSPFRVPIASYVVVHNIAKRHNVGTLARSATAFGVTELILVGRRDFNAFGSHGSTSHLRFRHFHFLLDARHFLKGKDCDICGVEIADGALPVNEHPFKKSTAFLLGNEGTGLSAKECEICDFFVYIPQYGCGTASLNVTVAASIVLHHFGVTKKLRQLCSRISWLIWKRPRPKVIIRRFGKTPKDRCKWKPGIHKSSPHLNRKRDDQESSERPIRIATFNVAMFSLAPAVPKAEEAVVFRQEHEDFMMFKNPVEMDTQAKSVNYHPKSILKQSPLHASLRSPEQLSPQKKTRYPDGRNYRSSVVLRSPVCLPAKFLTQFTNEENLKSSRSILEVLREVDADILALQDVKAEEEKAMRPLSDLAASLGMKYVFAESWAPEYGNAILSKWPIKRWRVQKIANDEDFRNVLKATISVPWAGEVDFYCTQLDHLDENWRMKQINAIIQSSNSPHILAGGLNSLTGSDYSPDRWMDIVKYYEDIGKPRPKIEVTNFLKGKEYIDAKDFAGECEPVVIIAKGQNVQGTCKYGTRVDYLLASQGSPYKLFQDHTR